MALPVGTRLGAYEILGPLGAGGMGEVFKARDGRLERIVAVKILPPHVAADPTLKQRFEREAKTLAALSHPNICVVFDVGHAATNHGDIDFLVMEYVEGETLAQRLQKGALPASDALRYAIEIADALDKAHRKNVVHRDLKPGNIMLTPAGAKLLDFGLAKRKPLTPPDDLTASPTATSPLTGSGSIVGTFQYMSPEQLEGSEADARTDIFAFGAVLYEMLTGHKAFHGRSQASLIGAILEREPQPVSVLQPDVPHAVDQLVKTCLAKSPESRWQSAGDIARQLKWILEDVSQARAVTAARPVRKLNRRMWVVPALATAAAALGFAVWTMTRSAPSPPAAVSRLLLAPSSNAPMVSVAGRDFLISPDGKRIVYLGAVQQGGSVFYLRELDSLESRAIAGTELPQNFGAPNPFFTDGGSSLVFRSLGKGILKVPLRGGPPIKIADDQPRFLSGVQTGSDGLVLALADGLYRASATGGPLERLTQPDEASMGYAAPEMVPGGKGILFHKRSIKEQIDRVVVLDLRTREQRDLAEDGQMPRYLSSGHLVFARGTTLMAMPFDVERLTASGTPVAVQEGINHPTIGAADYAVSMNGTLIYVPARNIGASAVTPVWVDRSGRELGPVISGSIATYSGVQLSPDGKHLLTISGDLTNSLWVYDLTGRPGIRLVDKGSNVSPLWSPDGLRIVFTSNRDGPFRVYSIPADGSTLEPSVIALAGTEQDRGRPTLWPNTWLPDKRLVFTDFSTSKPDLFVVPAKDGNKPEPLIQTEYTEDSARVSPDGRWLAYRSDRTGRMEIWVRAVSGGAAVRVSQRGGANPRWARNGGELFYREENKMMSVGIKPAGELAFAPAVSLFEGPYAGPYDVAIDGRFVMIPLPQQATPSSSGGLVVVQNWQEELKRLVPAK